MTEPGTPANPIAGRRHLVDNSVYARAAHPAVAPAWARAVRENLLVASGPFVLEAVISAEGAAEAEETLTELTEGLDYVRVDDATWELAFGAQGAMAAVSNHWHRRSPTDYLIAAVAHQHSLPVLHYDHDYPAIASDSGLRFEHTWIARPGSLEAAGEPVQAVRLLKRAITSRLRELGGAPGEEKAHWRTVAMLDAALEAAGRGPLPPPLG